MKIFKIKGDFIVTEDVAKELNNILYDAKTEEGNTVTVENYGG